MNAEKAMAIAFGWCLGVLSLMQLQVWRARWAERVARRGIFVNPNYIPVDERLADWNVGELAAPFVPTPRDVQAAPALQECPECGKAFKRVKTHMAMKHKVATPDE